MIQVPQETLVLQVPQVPQVIQETLVLQETPALLETLDLRVIQVQPVIPAPQVILDQLVLLVLLETLVLLVIQETRDPLGLQVPLVLRDQPVPKV